MGKKKVLRILFDQVNQNLGVGLGMKVVFGFERGFKLSVIFDDAVVDEGKSLGTIQMGVGIGDGDAAVGGPAGVAKTSGT